MICVIYRSKRKIDTYVYVVKQEDEAKNLDVVPETIHEGMGDLTYVMELDLESRESLARVDIEAVKRSLKEKGMYIQMPPSQEQMAALDEKLSRF
ncbi:MAG: YcgL domain-containing protein [Gammaproteobacteria bacterium]|nr:YcgL domain-containing protein [Gammaproteobacteria bacterium]